MLGATTTIDGRSFFPGSSNQADGDVALEQRAVSAPSADLGPQAELLEHLHGEGERALLVVEADERAALPG